MLLLIILSNVSLGFNVNDSKEKNCELFTDSLSVETYYKITGKDGSKFEGILIGQDTNKILVKNKSGKELNILRSQIKRIQDSSGNIVYQAVEIIEEEAILTSDVQINHNDSTDECTILLNSGNLLNEVRIVDSDDSTFTVTKSDFNKTFKIAGINTVEFEQHGFWKGFLYSGLGSVALWTVIGFIAFRPYNEYDLRELGFFVGALFAIPTGLITGAICEFLSNSVSYDFNKINFDAKSKRLRYIRGKHKY